MSEFRFNSLLAEAGLSPHDVRLLRHETQRHGKTPYALWRDNPARFNDYQRVQKISRSAWFAAPFWASFVVTPTRQTLFVGMFGVSPEGPIPAGWIDPISARDSASLTDYQIYSSQPLDTLSEYAGRLVIEWGAGAYSWVQLASNQNKPVTELRRSLIEPDFPGFMTFLSQLSDIESLPAMWRAILTSAKGVYLLTCPSTREQYVGSATGVGGFFGRWMAYVGDGHGGNVELKIRKPQDYRVSILQVAGSVDSSEDILAMESLWKAKLQSREMGLNRN